MFVIPVPLQIDLDDTGWFCGDDDRATRGASRTGMPRRHCAEDYAAINELGKALDMKIRCAFILGEWDPDNRLADMPHLSKYDGRWDNAAYFDPEEAKRCAEVINRSEYIDFVLHGINHGYYIEETDNPDVSDFYFYRKGELIMVPEDQVRGRLDAFFELMKLHGIEKEITGFIPPTGAYRFNELSPILSEYGIRYIGVPFKDVTGKTPQVCGVEDCGIITVDRCGNFIPWDMPDAPVEGVPEKGWETPGIFGVHWPNFLHMDPARNMETVERWVEYFKACGEKFGTVLSKDIEFAAHQLLYRTYARVREEAGKVIIDVSGVPCVHDFYVSLHDAPSGCIGADIGLYEDRGDFRTYRITPKAESIELSF